MADGVFGTPIDTETLKGMPEYRDKTIRRSDRAKVARDLMNAEWKDTNCRKYVEENSNSSGTDYKTLCTIYNATGDDLTFVLSHDWYGNVSDKPYPLVIKNGQWGGFLHVHPDLQPRGSMGAVVYRGLNDNDAPKNWFLSWSVPMSNLVAGENRVYTEVREDGHYNNVSWNLLYKLLNDAKMNSTDRNDGCTSVTIIGTTHAPSYTAIMSLTGPDPSS